MKTKRKMNGPSPSHHSEYKHSSPHGQSDPQLHTIIYTLSASSTNVRKNRDQAFNLKKKSDLFDGESRSGDRNGEAEMVRAVDHVKPVPLRSAQSTKKGVNAHRPVMGPITIQRRRESSDRLVQRRAFRRIEPFGHRKSSVDSTRREHPANRDPSKHRSHQPVASDAKTVDGTIEAVRQVTANLTERPATDHPTPRAKPLHLRQDVIQSGEHQLSSPPGALRCGRICRLHDPVAVFSRTRFRVSFPPKRRPRRPNCSAIPAMAICQRPQWEPHCHTKSSVACLNWTRSAGLDGFPRRRRRPSDAQATPDSQPHFNWNGNRQRIGWRPQRAKNFFRARGSFGYTFYDEIRQE